MLWAALISNWALVELKGNSMAEAMQALDQIQRLMIQTDHEEVADYLAIVERVAASTGDKQLQAQFNLQKARLLVVQENRVAALQFVEQARTLSQGLGNPDLEIDILRTLGNIFIQMHDYSKALEYLLEAVYIAREVGDRNRIATALNSIAICYWRLRDWVRAEEFLLEAMDHYLDDKRMRLMFENNIGVAQMEQGRYEEALERFYRALDFNVSGGRYFSLALNYSNIGDVYQRMGNLPMATQYITRSLEMAAEFSHPYVELRSSRHWARVQARQLNFDEATAFAHQSVQLARQLQDKAEELESLEALIEIQESAGRHAEALTTFREKVNLQQELLSSQLLIRSSLFNIQYATADRERELSALSAETQKERHRRNAVLVALAVVGIITLGLSMRYRFTRKVYKQLQANNHAIQTSHKHLADAYRELEELSREKDEILGIAAHDLRAPIATARSATALLLEQDNHLDTASAKALLSDLLATCDHMLATVSKLLQSHRLESNQIKCNTEPVPACDLRLHIERNFSAVAQRKQQNLDFKDWNHQLTFSADATLLPQVLDNLVSNALKFSPHGSSVFLSCCVSASHADQAIVSVQDQGPGIAAPHMANLFKKFSYVGNVPTGGEESTGLGLSIAFKLTKLMRGELLCKSNPAAGCCFSIILPLTR